MPQNLEVKARIPSIGKAARLARHLQARPKGILFQRDSYYNIPRGRLKLRIINHRLAELILYSRPDKKGSRYSDYVVLPVIDAVRTQSLCRKAFNKTVEVVKKRRLFLYKNSRIHLDDVRGLGTFIEFEVLVTKGKRQAQQLMSFLLAEFSISHSSIISGSYSDMLIRRKRLRNA
jgi:adenylate cyclase, class 2